MERQSGREYGSPSTRTIDSLIEFSAEGDDARHYFVDLTIDGETRRYWFSFLISARQFVRAEVFGMED